MRPATLNHGRSVRALALCRCALRLDWDRSQADVRCCCSARIRSAEHTSCFRAGCLEVISWNCYVRNRALRCGMHRPKKTSLCLAQDTLRPSGRKRQKTGSKAYLDTNTSWKTRRDVPNSTFLPQKRRCSIRNSAKLAVDRAHFPGPAREE